MTPAERPLCACGKPAAHVNATTLPGTEKLCYECRYARRHPNAGKRHTRSRTENMVRLSKRVLAEDAAAYPPSVNASYPRPYTRGDCLPGGCNAERPCPWVSCKYHLALDVDGRRGSIKHNFPDTEVWEMGETCALDVAERENLTLEATAGFMNLTRERVRQLEVKAIAKALASPDAERLRVDYLDHEPHCTAALPPPFAISGLHDPVAAYQRKEREWLYSLGWALAGASADSVGKTLYWRHPVWGNALSLEQAVRVSKMHHATVAA